MRSKSDADVAEIDDRHVACHENEIARLNRFDVPVDSATESRSNVDRVRQYDADLAVRDECQTGAVVAVGADPRVHVRLSQVAPRRGNSCATGRRR